MVSGTLALPKKVVINVEGGSRAAAPKGSMTHVLIHKGNFLLLALGTWSLVPELQTICLEWFTYKVSKQRRQRRLKLGLGSCAKSRDKQRTQEEMGQRS